jgi:hypothetical protein
VISIIVDGIDGRKTILPYFYGQPKSVDGSEKYEFKVRTLYIYTCSRVIMCVYIYYIFMLFIYFFSIYVFSLLSIVKNH